MKDSLLFYDEDCDSVTGHATPVRVKDQVFAWFDYLYSLDIDVIGYVCLNNDLSFVRDVPSAEKAGDRYSTFESMQSWLRVNTLREMWSEGTDTMHLACQAARKHDKAILGQMRMSDAHHAQRSEGPGTGTEWLCPKTVYDHPEWRIVKQDGQKDMLLDYSYSQVREMKLAYLRELAENYDLDGLQLNWMRWCRHFTAAKQREKAPTITDFLRDVRHLLDDVGKKKGKRLLLVHQVAAELEENLDIGCDVATWVEAGLADALQPMDFLHADFNIRTEQFVEVCRDSDCGVYPTIHRTLGGDTNNTHRQSAHMTADKFRAIAYNFAAWGAQGCTVYNFCNWGYFETAKEYLEQAISILASPEAATSGPRYYHFIPIWKWHSSGKMPTGRANSQRLQFRSDELGQRLGYTFRMADGRNGENLKGHLCAWISDATPQDAFELDLNGTPIDAEAIHTTFFPIGDDDVRHLKSNPSESIGARVHQAGLRLEVDLRDCPLFKGDNELGVVWTKKNWQIATDPYMEVLQVYVQK